MDENFGNRHILGKEGWSARLGIRADGQYDRSEMQAIARRLVQDSTVVRAFVPSGYAVKPGERVLMVVNSFYDSAVVEVMAQAIIEAQASVDVICVDMGPDRRLNEDDELKAFIHNWAGVPENNEFRAWTERIGWVDRLAAEENYDLLIHGVGQQPVQTSYRSETLPWTCREVFPAASFPLALWNAINAKTWDQVFNKGRGGRVRITDPEGTDISFTLFEEYYDINRYKDTNTFPYFQANPVFGHLFGRQTPPFYRDNEDAKGVVAGTTNHFSCPYPNARAHIEGGKLVALEGGGKYGDAWRELLSATEGIKYPEYPGKGLFWWWEAAIGTNPKMRRPSNIFTLSGCGTTYERLRSGVVHMGLGTAMRGPSEQWAAQEGLPYGHLHIHLLNCTYEINCRDGTELKVIDNGHLTALDDPQVIEVASKFGDPEDLLREVWRAPIPGITEPGNYWEDYAQNPVGWLEAHRGA